MTFQVRETMIYRGERREILALPLRGCGQPVPDFRAFSTACRRGYQGTWELRDDALHLVHLASPGFRGDDRDRLTEMFPEAAGPVEATWFSGEIVPDDLTDPKDADRIESHKSNDWPLHFLRFTLVIHRGKLLSELTTDLVSGATQARLTRRADGLFPPDELGFLHAIHADPDDSTAKLAYADWLDERDDPRGSRLRLEVERRVKEGPWQPVSRPYPRWEIPSGSVPPEDTLWYWCRLAGIPELTPEDKDYQQFLERLRSPSG